METGKYIYRFGGGEAEGDRSMEDMLGGKGANLAEMSAIGLPVPPGFTISAEVCSYYLDHDGDWPEGLEEQVGESISHIEEQMGLAFGDSSDPLLVSIRSGAGVSMPGMMDTVLNLGLNDQSVKGLAEKAGSKRFACDCYRRFIDMFGDVVMGVDHEHFEESLQSLKEEVDAELDTDLDTGDLKELVDRYKEVYRQNTDQKFPQDPREQLHRAINGVFGSWNTLRARKYRKINKITGLPGTAVNVQAMVFGNTGENSAAGVCFSRNPANGTNELYGEFLINAQGEDVVSGIRTPRNIDELEELMPECYEGLQQNCRKLEEHYQKMQDIEFTIQEGELFILQTRNGKRTGTAAVKIATDMVEEGLTSRENSVRDLVEPEHLTQLLHPQLVQSEIDEDDIMGEGIAASPGAAVGKVVFSSQKAEQLEDSEDPIILVRIETSSEEVGGMSAADGILTSRGGMTSHAAVVARGWGKPCVSGCGDISIDYEKKVFTNGDITIREGDWISLDGGRGLVLEGKKPLEEPSFGDDYNTFMSWVDDIRDMEVHANADTPEDAQRARKFGVEGIGLVRTEHMFFGEDRIQAMQRMILSDEEQERRDALEELLPYQKQDFIKIFEAMEGLPVTVRLLDPPLHEFLPDNEDEVIAVAEQLDIAKEELEQKIEDLKEFNPMLGHRGCRLGITHPEITQMQSRAIFEAAVYQKKEGTKVRPEVMVPLIGTPEEFNHQKELIDEMASKIFEEEGESVEYRVGTMIEIPRASFVADKIAENAEFFSFGTNDLTQMTFGFSRDDAEKFLDTYSDEGILKDDPFKTIDKKGVGRLIAMATEKGRSAREDLTVGICGEHGGDPDSIAFCYEAGLDYVSCSPYRVPVARLAAAQARLKAENAKEEAK